MLYVARNREIIFNWYLYEGTNKRVVDFAEIPGCRPTAFLVNKKGQYTYRLEYQVDASAIPFVRIVIPKDSLAPDVYDMKIVWEVPEEKDIRLRLRHNNRFLAVSHIAGVMKVTANIAEDNTGLPAGQALVRTVKSLSESFGYDGLSAYELAVLRKGYTGTEEEYITQFERVPLYRTADTDNPDDERALSSLRAYRDLVEKDKVVRNADIDEQDTEDTSRVPTAYALRYVKDLITPISDLPGVGVLSKTASGWAFTQFPEGLQLGEDSDTAYAGDKGKKNREDIDALQRRVDKLPDTVASKEELKAVENKIGREIIDLNQQVTEVEKDVEDKANTSDLEELREYVSDRLSPVGSDVRPIYIDEEGTKEINGIVVPKDIISLTGGIASKGIADFGVVTEGSTGGGGSRYLIDLIDVVIYNPKNDEVLAYDTTTNKWINKESNAATLQGYTADELLQKFTIENEAITISVGGKSLSITKEQLKRLFTLQDAGTESRPIYIEDGNPKEINSLSIPGNIESTNGGIAAKGIADFGNGGGGGGIGSQVIVEPIITAGIPIVNIIVDGETYTILAPSSLFTEADKEKLDSLYNYDDSAIRRELLTKVSREELKSKGTEINPIYFDDKSQAKEVTGVRVPNNIESLHGGVSAKGVADFGIGGGEIGGSQVVVLPILEAGEEIAKISVDGYEHSIYSPDISGKVDKEVGKGLSSNDYTDEDKSKISQIDKKLDKEIYDNHINALKDKGSKTRPVYFNESGTPDIIDGLIVPNDIQSLNGGVSAKGIADFGSGSGGGSQVSITPLTTNGNAIAKVTIDGDETTLYSPTVDLSGKVDKEAGKGLSSNDFTDQEKDKLAGLHNYDDTSIWREVNKKVDKDNLKDKGNDLRPVYFDADAVAHEIRGVRVPDSIESIDGGVSAKGIADFGIGAGNGSQVKVTPLVNDGQAIAQIEVDGKQNTLYAPNPDISSKVEKSEFNTYKEEVSRDITQLTQDIDTEANTRRAKDQELGASIQTLQDLFTEDGKAKNADRLDGKSIEELFDSLDAQGGINITIGGIEKTLTKSELLTMLGFVNTGKHNLPVYYEDEQMKVIDSLSVSGNIESRNGGVSAKGISDFGTPSGAGGAVGIDVLRDDELDGIHESITQVATAYAVSKIRDIINIDDIEEFSEDKDYGRGNLVRRGDRLYRFFYNHSAGAWASGDVEPVNITTLSTPLSITDNDLMNILK